VIGDGVLTVEFFGLPGAGKSSVAHAVARGLGVPVCVQRNSRKDLLRRHPFAFAEALHSSRKMFGNWVNPKLGFQLYVRGRQQQLVRETTVFEEGVVLEIWRHLVHGRLQNEPWQELLAVPFADVLVVVDAPDQLIRTRLQGRATNVDLAVELAESTVESLTWSRAREVLDEVATHVALHQSVIYVRNDRTLDKAREFVGTSLLRMLEQRRGRPSGRLFG